MTKSRSINPIADQMMVSRHHRWQDYVDGIRSGDRRWLAQSITLIESSLQADQEKAIALLSQLPEPPQPTVRIAISGPPGVGKSTLIEQLGLLDCHAELAVAVLAIDPSSSRSGGSLLGDKTRMDKLVRQSQAFIRPSPSRGHLGGVAPYTRETISLCEAAGFNRIYIETVGVGQSEYEAAGLTDLFVLVLQPGSGDQLQGIKKGIVEMADLLVINKSDGSLVGLAQRTQSDYQQALQLMHNDQPPPISCISAQEGTGLENLRQQIELLITERIKNGAYQRRRNDQYQEWFRRSLERQLLQWVLKDAQLMDEWKEMEAAVMAGSTAPVVAAARCMQAIRSAKPAIR